MIAGYVLRFVGTDDANPMKSAARALLIAGLARLGVEMVNVTVMRRVPPA